MALTLAEANQIVQAPTVKAHTNVSAVVSDAGGRGRGEGRAGEALMRRVLIALAMFVLAACPRTAGAIEVGEPAPDFRLPSTADSDISLSDYKGQKWVLLEFYAADFAPA
jgi:AhpC/TSA family